jgi:PAS domain S-box-containing protein
VKDTGAESWWPHPNRANAFFENILNSFHDGLIVVDGELRVQAWNHRAEHLWGLRSSEVVGKHLMNLDIGLPTGQLRQPVRQCLSGDSSIEPLQIPETNRRGRSIRLDITCARFAVGNNPTWGALHDGRAADDPDIVQPRLTPAAGIATPKIPKTQRHGQWCQPGRVRHSRWSLSVAKATVPRDL